jgi:hypothetical protein
MQHVRPRLVGAEVDAEGVLPGGAGATNTPQECANYLVNAGYAST